jgi:hypothetical protein
MCACRCRWLVIREETILQLPDLHPGQLRAYEVFRNNRFVVGRCGRRWGKTDFGKTIACDGAAKGQIIGWFAPDYKRLSEAYAEIADTLRPISTLFATTARQKDT